MKALPFDLDSTLADTAPDLGPALVSGFFEKGYNIRHEHYFYCRHS